jgi:hypothetical protein
MTAALRLAKNKGLIPFPLVLSPVRNVITSEFRKRRGSFTPVLTPEGDVSTTSTTEETSAQTKRRNPEKDFEI